MADLPPIVFTHGLGSTYEHNWVKFGWADLFETEGRKVVGHNMAGHGGSPRLAEGETGPGRLHDLIEGLGGKVDGVGFSAGAVLTLTAAVQRPELFRRLVLMGTGDRSYMITLEQKRLNLKNLDDANDPTLRGIRLAAERAGNDFEDVMWSANNTYPVPSFEDMAAVTCPVLLILGEEDMVGPADQMLEALPDARLVKLRRTDHFSTTQRFEAQEATVAFLSE